MSSRRHRFGWTLTPVLGLLLLQACTVGPDYELPVIATPDAWHQRAVEGLSEGEASLQTWWQELDDPVLTGLIRRAGSSNLDLREAMARILEARARLGVASGQKLPDVDASAFFSYGEQSDQGPLGSLADLIGGFDAQELYNAGVDASWEIDVFGRIRRSVESAAAGYEASIEDYRDVLVTMYAEVALNYVEARALQDRIAYALENAEAQRASVALTRDLHDAGASSALDVSQAESNLAATEAAIPALEIALSFALHRLAVLLGEPPGALYGELSQASTIPASPAEIATGLPAEALRQRPDVRRAERQLAAQSARIGVATADLYPRFSLSGFFALEATDVSNLGDGATWGIVPGLRWNLFDGGRVRSAIQVEEARTEQALVRYERTILRALEEVENALVSYTLEQRRRERLQAAVTATQRTVELVEIQYRSGLTDFQNVLDAQRSLFVQQDQLATSEGQVTRNLIALYKALGGGWDPESPPPEPAPEGDS
ncbi:MAG: efflux transporter outer membrane subunit [bacterium]|nr:efflux transporter outer membrane subunit [bacterium]